MRVIAGKYKKTPLLALQGEEITRPTKDMVKEALFSSIMVNCDCRFLDLFSGSGAIGIEAISRGAKEVVFNDRNKEAIAIIRTKLNTVKEEREILQLDYEECLKALQGRTFDIIFCDPPYRFDQYEQIFSLCQQYQLLSKQGSLILEVHKDTKLKERYADMICFKDRKYGISRLLYYRKEKQL